MKRSYNFLRLVGLMLLTVASLKAEAMNEKSQARVDFWIAEAKTWAADPNLVKAVAAQNTSLPAEYAAMTQEKWETLSDVDPLVRALTKNAASQVLRDKKTDALTEAFVSDAKGLKVAFLTKSTSWSHSGKPKHDVPMTGQTWQGKLELDKSSGARQIQVSVPIQQDGKPIGSLVIGVSLSDIAAQ